MADDKDRARRVTGGASPQNKAKAPGETRGATPRTDTAKPDKPPKGASGVTPGKS